MFRNAGNKFGPIRRLNCFSKTHEIGITSGKKLSGKKLSNRLRHGYHNGKRRNSIEANTIQIGQVLVPHVKLLTMFTEHTRAQLLHHSLTGQCENEIHYF